MSLFSKALVSLLATASLATTAAAATCSPVLKKDVVIVGGGASGAHAAVRLREDLGQSIVLIEKEAILVSLCYESIQAMASASCFRGQQLIPQFKGGHVNTYVDPSSGDPYDYGVQSYLDVHGASDFFARLGVETKTPGRVTRKTRYIDFKTGHEVNYTGPASADQSAALAKYAQICAQYEDMLLPSYWNFPAPKDIPADLLMPFGDFVKKYGIEAVAPIAFQVTGLGVGDIAERLTIWVMQAFGGPMARSFLGQQASFVPASGRNQDIYDAIGKLLGKDVLYSSTVIKSKRSKNGVSVTVSDSEGKKTEIQAKRLLIAIEPTDSNLAPFDLDANEKKVFSKFDYSQIACGIVTNPALPAGYSLTNLPETAAPSNFLEFPDFSFTARFDWLGTEAKDLFRIMIVGDKKLDGDDAKKLVHATFDTIVKGGVVDKPVSTKLDFTAFTAHGAMHMRVSADELKKGFIQDLYALQGGRSTWWTGGAWVAQFQTHLWWYNDILLPKLTKGM